jgi:hypothetical protein
METGLKFNRYKPRNAPKESHPSEWWIFVYQTRKTLRMLRLWSREDVEENSMTEKSDDGKSSRRQSEVGDNRSSRRKWSWGFLRKRENKQAAEA